MAAIKAQFRNENDKPHILETVKKLPLTCGVYIMKSKEEEILYVGKAASLKKRVSSYFSKTVPIKTNLLIEKVSDIDYIECESDEQALILEAALIKEKKPKYNVSLKDNSGYPYVEITADEFPRIFVTRKKENKNSRYFGSYPDVGILRAALNLIRKVFPFCSCRCFRNRVCLFYHLGLCSAPCSGKISTKAYKENIQNIIKILKGQREELLDALRKRMQVLSNENKFEEAAALRDKIIALTALYRGKTITHELISLKEILGLISLPLNIEAIDISSLGMLPASGSLVVFRNGVADKNSYRRYRIKEVSGINDYAMLAEVVKRRYRRLIEEKIKMPDLIIVDGGLGHAAAAKKELEKLSLNIPVIGIAKRNEEVWFPGKNKPLVIPKDNPALHLIQRLRDEAHRFAHKYHLLLRERKQFA
jgi:excinuclease ABC subunit C